MKKALGIVQVQATIPALFTLGLIQTSLKSMEISPLMSVGFGSGPRLLQPLLRSYSGSSPIEVNEIIPWYNRAHCQEDFNDIQPTFSMSSNHPIIPSYVSLSSFFQGPNPNLLTRAKLPLTSIKEAGSHCHLYYSEAAVMPPPWCHHIGKPCMVFFL